MIKCLFPVLIDLFNVLQAGVTEEQMLKFMGANTTLTPKEAVRLLEVCIDCIVSVYKCLLFRLPVVTMTLVSRVTQLWSAYILHCVVVIHLDPSCWYIEKWHFYCNLDACYYR